jgi:hypothetical protein
MAMDRRAPPWPAVVATTLHLWLGRRGNTPGGLSRHRWTVPLAVLAVVAVAAGLAVSARGHTGSASPARGKAASGGLTAGAAGQDSETAAAGREAASWVAGQVSRDAMVACDPAMCRMLRARGLAAGSLLALGPGAVALRFCDLVVATRAVRDLVGSRLQRSGCLPGRACRGSGSPADGRRGTGE